MPVRVSGPTGISGLVDTIQDPAYATAVGLLRWGATQIALGDPVRYESAPGRRWSRPDPERVPLDLPVGRALAGARGPDRARPRASPTSRPPARASPRRRPRAATACSTSSSRTPRPGSWCWSSGRARTTTRSRPWTGCCRATTAGATSRLARPRRRPRAAAACARRRCRVPVLGGRLALGTWQSITLLDPNEDNATRGSGCPSSRGRRDPRTDPATPAGPIAGARGYTPLSHGAPRRAPRVPARWEASDHRQTPPPAPANSGRAPMPLRSDSENFALIRVIGVGGGGSNAVNRMIRAEMMGVEFIACNTDAQALLQSDAPHKIRIGDKITRGLGAGGDSTSAPAPPRRTGTRSRTRSRTRTWCSSPPGSAAAPARARRPVVAEIAKEQGALTIGVVTKPFSFEGSRRKLVAEKAAEELKAKVDTLITIPNDRLRDVVQKNTSIVDAFRVVDDVLRQGVAGISDIITVPGLINLDFADVRTIMKDAGSALMGIGRATGREPRPRGRPPGRREPAARGQHLGRAGHPVQHHGRGEPDPLGGDGGRRGDPRRRRSRGEHHLRDELQRAPGRGGDDHRHRHRLRRPPPERRRAGRRSRADAGHERTGTRRRAPGRRPPSRTTPIPARDFLEELERQRTEVGPRRAAHPRTTRSPCPSARSAPSARPRPARPRRTTPTTSRSRASCAAASPARVTGPDVWPAPRARQRS